MARLKGGIILELVILAAFMSASLVVGGVFGTALGESLALKQVKEATVTHGKGSVRLTLDDGNVFIYTVADLSCDSIPVHPLHNGHFGCGDHHE